MNGMAGTGKTTIAYTVCTELEKANQLGASFFCSRTISECRQVKHIIPSIAYQLARFSLPFKCALSRALDKDPDAHTREPNVQYNRLIMEPLVEVQDSLPADFIVVIDALDECENDNAVGQVLDVLLSTSSTHSLPIRYLISSRPEGEITQKMAKRLDGQDESLLVLHDLESTAVKEDIEAYMRAELKDISLDETHWPVLLKRCGVLFIYASTACRFIRLGYDTDTLDEAISTVCQSDSIPMQHENPIDTLYLTILEAAFESSAMSEQNIKRRKDMLEMVICAIEPMTTEMIAGLLGLRRGTQVYALLKPLRSVLNIPKMTGVVTTLHASFPDFMLSKRSHRFCCNRSVRHTTMALACLGIVDQAEPKVNICALPSSYMLDKEIGDLKQRVSRSITAPLIYACRYWSTHLARGEPRDGLINYVFYFFESKLLLWMEVMNLTGHMRYGTRIIMDAEKWCSERQAPEGLTKLAHDASQFVSIYANHPVSQSTPHIYVSMLPFWPRSRPISVGYRPRITGLVKPTGTAFDRRRLALIATWKVSTRAVDSISLSANGTRLVVPTDSGIDVYDTTTGESVLTLADERAQNVSYVAISPDGTQVAFAVEYGAPYLWDIVNEGKVTPLLPKDILGACSISFSPDGLHVACGLWNGDAYICEPRQDSDSAVLLKGHTKEIYSVTFSPNGKHLASGSADNTVRVWDLQTGKPVGDPFEGHSDWIQMVSYSPDGSRLASASDDRTVQVWDPQTGKIVLGPLTGHSNYVLSATFSPNGTLVASGSRDRTIRVYDAQTGQTALGPLEGHTHWVNSVIFSLDSTRLYSCSFDGTVQLL
ncbi:Vegetative incompatibility protein HET-E-1 OS=Podospora anserina GN=HET-E1 PE=4 SV=1 [Rhizoctonia solani AG-1 IB]|uniref:Vegetative incompatibility protein HET-E-1 n=1 Tax=Thanatephorus cucumeris (strain AG1-IB / isolate 7/3/14) TaxID=1108050 RepID=A0A0B7FU01_THACB|nr:Vegetative incompatibility protein HET-E-1 OS=Podospora anserina GN=HET-E1 PE=4 SV=1 [Rhizoctonia solani AG-1 IB]